MTIRIWNKLHANFSSLKNISILFCGQYTLTLLNRTQLEIRQFNVHSKVNSIILDVNSLYEREYNHGKRTLALFILTSTYPADRTFLVRPFGCVEARPIPLPRRSRLTLWSKEIHTSTSLPFDIDGTVIIFIKYIIVCVKLWILTKALLRNKPNSNCLSSAWKTSQSGLNFVFLSNA